MSINVLKKTFLYHFWFKMSIRGRLILYFILSVLIPTSVIASTIYHKSSNIITGKMSQLVEKNLNSAETSILQKLETADDISTLISLNSKLMEILEAKKPQDSIYVVQEINDLNAILEGYHLSNLTNFTKTTLFPKIYMLDRPEYKNFRFSDKVFDISEIENEKWYQEFPYGVLRVVGLDKIRTLVNTTDSIKVARKLYTTKSVGTEYNAILTIDIETNYFNDILENAKASAGSTVFIVNENDETILKTKNYDSSKISIDTSFKNIYGQNPSYNSWIAPMNGAEMLVSVKPVGKVGWKLVSISPIKELNKEIISFNKLVYIVIAICGIISFLMALLLSNDISRPITKLVKSMSSVKEGNFDINISYKRNDEFAFLVEQYKTMMKEIGELIDKLYISELAKKKVELRAKEYELKALQAQINPHFLYNTLDSVNWLALKYKAQDISIMVKSLSNFFRYSLSKGKSEITLEEEKGQIESYLMIQSIRFKEKLNYRVDFSPEILRCKTVKLILQPIVENAIIHGIDKRKQGGFIEILGYKVEDHIEIKISDNGVGADVQELNNLLKDRTESDTFFGTKNVNERIKQFFGDEYGLQFYSNEAGGVTVQIRLPFKLEGQDMD